MPILLVTDLEARLKSIDERAFKNHLLGDATFDLSSHQRVKYHLRQELLASRRILHDFFC